MLLTALVALAIIYFFFWLFLKKQGARWLTLFHCSYILLILGGIMNYATVEANGGRMPVYVPAIEKLGLKGEMAGENKTYFFVPEGQENEVKLFPLIDRYPSPFRSGVMSLGDILINVSLVLLIIFMFVNGAIISSIYLLLVLLFILFL